MPVGCTFSPPYSSTKSLQNFCQSSAEGDARSGSVGYFRNMFMGLRLRISLSISSARFCEAADITIDGLIILLAMLHSLIQTILRRSLMDMASSSSVPSSPRSFSAAPIRLSRNIWYSENVCGLGMLMLKIIVVLH